MKKLTKKSLLAVLAVIMVVATIAIVTIDVREMTNEEIAERRYVEMHGEGDYDIEIYRVKNDGEWVDFFVYEDGEWLGGAGINVDYYRNKYNN